ncbi:MAG: alpha/beta hydrolase [Prolixibacteraceae bacterium]|nr:alpha/beta hydrolase [Burkholderiales bacterium]
MAALALLVTLTYCGVLHADEVQPGKVVRVETRGVFVPIYTIWKEGAVATVVLYSGGGGGYGKIGDDGWPSSKNFLIRSAKLFATHPFNVILVGRASDVSDLDGMARTGDSHDQDNQAIFRSIKAKSAAPVWLVGTSMGTISATSAAIRNGGPNVAGIVLTSSVTSYRTKGAVPTQELDKIKVPVLVVHHERDACKICLPHEAKNIVSGLKNAPIKKTIFVNGGSGESGDPCEALHHHGFIGMEKEVVDLTAAWIQNPTN